MAEKNRRLPRHVDGRIMIYKMPLTKLPLFLIIILSKTPKAFEVYVSRCESFLTPPTLSKYLL